MAVGYGQLELIKLLSIVGVVPTTYQTTLFDSFPVRSFVRYSFNGIQVRI